MLRGIEGAYARYRVIWVSSVEERIEVYRIRYEVYCEERGWEEGSRWGLEMDEYDNFSEYCLVQDRESGEYVGCLRLVLENFPLKEELGVGGYREGEIGRLAVRVGWRRDIGIALLLYYGIFVIGNDIGVGGYYVLIGRALRRRLEGLGIGMEEVGGVIERNGERSCYRIDKCELLRLAEGDDLYREVSENMLLLRYGR